mmetsp:Transcript_15426/g.31665  ORF Transcript_15426/g.31665 Transcript_15426/m.31665 type:complete len:81 (+) Transcript_15426:861-1103(+)
MQQELEESTVKTVWVKHSAMLCCLGLKHDVDVLVSYGGLTIKFLELLEPIDFDIIATSTNYWIQKVFLPRLFVFELMGPS